MSNPLNEHLVLACARHAALCGSCYRLGNGGWEAMASMSNPRSSFTVAECGGMLYAIGGYDGRFCLSSVERYSTEANLWEDVPAMAFKR